jgi:hypothetical protein
MAHYTIARPILRRKVKHESGDTEERVIWAVPTSGKYPEGIRYRLAYIPKGERRPAVLYDNHYPKGHHFHEAGLRIPYRFKGLAALFEDFERDVAALRWRR